jgi:monoamine oxidase
MDTFDVIVIGGGFAGVRAARDLADAGRSVLILEARDRLGGKTWSREFPGTSQRVELGGTWVSPKYHPYVTQEIQRYGLQLAESHGGDVRFSWLFPDREARSFPVEGDELYDLERALFEIIANSRRIELDTPRDRQDLADLDVPVSDFLDRLEIRAQTRSFLEAWAAIGSGALPTEWSALTALSWIAAMGNSTWAWYAAVAEKFADGTGGVIDKMTAGSDVDVILSAPVGRIAQDGEGVTVATRDGSERRAGHVVVASPISTWNDIDWSPALSAAKVDASNHPHPGRMRKLWVRVANAPSDVIGFGLGAELLWISPEYDLGDSQLMVAFSAPQNGFGHADESSVQRAVEHHFPGAQVLAFEEHDWATDPFTKGTWTCTRPGQLSGQSSLLQQTEGRVLFANADIATRWIGWIDGAMESGAKAAAEIIGRSGSRGAADRRHAGQEART